LRSAAADGGLEKKKQPCGAQAKQHGLGYIIIARFKYDR
jgi:hypothetical protein